nr:VP3 [megrivirus C2]
GSTFLHSFSRLFLQWTGSIVYTVEWTGPAVSAGRLILGFQPNANRESKLGSYAPALPTGNVLSSLSQGPHMIWDLSNSTSMSFRADFALPSEWAAVNPLVTAGTAGGTNPSQTTQNGGVINFSSSGSCYLALLTPIVTPTVVQSSFKIVLSESAGPDFSLRYFAPRSPNTYPIYNGIIDQ